MLPITISKESIKLLNFNNQLISYLFIDNNFFVELSECLALVADTTQAHRLSAATENGLITHTTGDRPKKNFVSLETGKKELLRIIATKELDFDLELFVKALYTKQGLTYKTFQDIQNELSQVYLHLESLENLHTAKMQTFDQTLQKLESVCQINENLESELNELKVVKEATEGDKNQLLDTSKMLEETTKEQAEKLEKLEQDAKEAKEKIELLEKQNAENALLVEQFEALKAEQAEKTTLTIYGEKIENFFHSRFLPFYGFVALFGVMGVFSWFVLYNFLHLDFSQENKGYEFGLIGVLAFLFAVVFELCMMIFSLEGMIKHKNVLMFVQFLMVGLKTSIFLPSFYEWGEKTPQIIFAWVLTFILPFLQYALSEIVRMKKKV